MIDIDHLQTGDHVELEWTSPQGETAKVSGKVWKWSGYQPMVGPFALTGDQFKIISHKRGEPEWAGALVVRDKDGEYWGLDGDRYVCLADDPIVGNNIGGGHMPSAMHGFGPFTVIIDADGLDVEAQYFWKQQLQARDEVADLRAKLDEAEERAETVRKDYERLSDQYDEQVGRAERAERDAVGDRCIPPCTNCDGRKCMGCVFGEPGHECKDNCPRCCPSEIRRVYEVFYPDGPRGTPNSDPVTINFHGVL